VASTTESGTTSLDVVRGYFAAMGRRDLEEAGSYWAQAGVERLIGQQDLVGPRGIREFFAALFEAFPDWQFEVLDTISEADRTVVRWRARATFAGPAHFQGFAPNGARMEIEGCDVMTVVDGLIQRNDVYMDSGEIARQLGFLPPTGSATEARVARLANLRTRLQAGRQGSEPERVADGVWIVRGGFPLRTMNVYLIEDEDGVTVFDAGVEDMVGAIRKAAARLGGIKRVVLGHADADHRGAAPGLGADVYCHPAEVEAAQSPDPMRPYHHFERLEPPARWVIPRLMPVWDGGRVQIAGTVTERDEIAGFRVIELPGHAPGLIGLFRDRDRLALVSDCFYTLDLRTGLKASARVPHPSTNLSTQQAAESIRKLAALNPSAAWAGHTDPVTGDVVTQLEHAAATAPIDA
jgi:glyoxylase-like metal-dependent hydrolase (beta-lactamase superfamily II)/predicted ester cyclase